MTNPYKLHNLPSNGSPRNKKKVFSLSLHPPHRPRISKITGFSVISRPDHGSSVLSEPSHLDMGDCSKDSRRSIFSVPCSSSFSIQLPIPARSETVLRLRFSLVEVSACVVCDETYFIRFGSFLTLLLSCWIFIWVLFGMSCSSSFWFSWGLWAIRRQ